MKNSALKSLALLTFVALFAFTGSLKAQIWPCPYKIDNGTGCSITVDFQISCGGGATICPLAMGVVIPANSTYIIPCSTMDPCCTGPWDVSVTITDFGGAPVSAPQTVSSTNTGPFSWGPCALGVPPACCSGTAFKIVWTSTVAKIF